LAAAEQNQIKLTVKQTERQQISGSAK